MDGGDVGSLVLYGLAPRVAGVGLVPVLHGSLAEPPAEKYTPPFALTREINEAKELYAMALAEMDEGLMKELSGSIGGFDS